MSGSIARSVQQIKGDLRSVVAPNLILRLCQAAGHAWRDRTLGPVETLSLFVAQILHGNTSCAHVRHARPGSGCRWRSFGSCCGRPDNA
jgi:hypothetical protein